MPEKRITLIGAGLAGSLLSIYLAKRGHSVEVYERRPDMRHGGTGAGRSINLAISTRGLNALSCVGMEQRILDLAIPMRGRLLHAHDGSLSLQPYSQNKSEVINSVSRGELNKQLLDEAEQRYGVTFHFDQKCVGVNFKNRLVHFEGIGEETHTLYAPHPVIGTDGSASAIRSGMLHRSRFNFSQDYLKHGYKELTIPPDPEGRFRLDKNALHIWPRHTFMLIALPNLDGSFTCTLFLPFEGEPSFATLRTESDVLRLFRNEFPDATEMMPGLVEDFFANPTGSLVTVKCYPWSVSSQACLLGDAAHAVVPFFGQGMNCAFEDCIVLDQCIEEHEGDWAQIFAAFEQTRKPDADAIADMALENYFEMRDHVADPHFRLRKEVEFELEKRYPDKFVPRYCMVTFRLMPYSVARSRGQLQETLLQKLCTGIKAFKEVDWQLAHQLVQALPPLPQQRDNAASKS